MTRTRNLGMPIDESPDIHRAHRHPSILRTDDNGLRFLACLSEIPKCLGVAVQGREFTTLRLRASASISS